MWFAVSPELPIIMKETNYKYLKSDIEKITKRARISDHVGEMQRVGNSCYVKCPNCGEFGKKNGKMRGMKITDNSRMQLAKCFSCGHAITNAVSAEMEFGHCDFLTAVERCAAGCGVILETNQDRRRRLAREASANIKETFVERQLKASGLVQSDCMARIVDADGEESWVPVFSKGSLDARGKINPDDDDMLITYYDLFGKKVQFATRSNGTGLRDYIRIRWQYPSQHVTADGKEIKYQTIKGCKARFYIPQKIRDYYAESTPIDTLIIQEGEKKAEKACKHGLPSIAIQGIFNIGNPQDGLMKELSYIVQRCAVKNVVLLFDSDWNDLGKNIKNGDAVDQRPKTFYRAAVKFRNYVQSLHNEGLHVDIWFGHLNSEREKGIDDLLTGSLAGKEDEFAKALDFAMHAHDGASELVNVHKISTITDYQIRDFWSLNKVDDFLKIHEEELKELRTINCLNAFYARNEAGDFVATTATGDNAKFWDIEYDDKGKEQITFHPIKMVDFLSANGFKKICSLNTSVGNYDIVRIEDGVITPSSIVKIKCYISEFLAQAAPDSVCVKMLDNFPKVVTPDKIMTLPEIADTSNQTWPNMQVFCYRSGFVSISPDGIEVNAPGHVIWEESVIKRNFKRIPLIEKLEYVDGKYQIKFTPEAERCEFLTYLKDVSNMWHDNPADFARHQYDAALHLVNKLSCAGYLLHFFRPMNEAKAIIAMDYTESEVGDSNGRTGKSLFSMAIANMVPQAMVDGKNFDPKFMFSTVTPRTRNILVDDVKPNFQFTELYQAITGDVVVNFKGASIFNIPRDMAPKIIVTTNHAIKSLDDSTKARRILMGFGNYYSPDFSPADKFGHCFFTEWDEEQWLLFVILCANACGCISGLKNTGSTKRNRQKV